MDELIKIYIVSIEQLVLRLNASKDFLDVYNSCQKVVYLESAILQLRKALELLAFASISPNKKEYEKFRMKAESASDYRKDFKASTIVKNLRKINQDFYPLALLEPIVGEEGIWHFERKIDGFLTLSEFITLYDRVGKYLHADNPWGNDKKIEHFSIELLNKIQKIESLLELYTTVIRGDSFLGLWVIKTTFDPISVNIMIASSDGEFVVNNLDG